jgi:hypothetical protein
MARDVAATIPDELARYQVAIAPIYQCLRRILVQLAGIAILAESGRQKQWREHLTSAAVSQSLNEAEECILSTSAPDGMAHVHQSLIECARDLRWTLQRMGHIGARMATESGDLDSATRLDRAYRALRGAAVEQLGFTLVDMRQSCCCLPGCAGSQQHSA